MGSISRVVGWLGSPATLYHRAGSFASHSFERFAFLATSFLVSFIGTFGKNLKCFFAVAYLSCKQFEFMRKVALPWHIF
jgi:hypothetical protein